MSHTIESVEHWPSGDTRIFPFVVPDEDSDVDDARKDITAATVDWKLEDTTTGDTVISESDSGVDVNITNASEGEFEVEVDKSATEDLADTYREIIKITDSAGNRSSWAGRVKISEIEK